ncbi:hypothetical protein GBAR_LOCUS31400 [Geodia barretti]|uniref:Uncharacterized protein n=1 Tax=Geodia barretti TaxID=519541 RepID=A0AA35U0X8_GEOBA|nr:hypothetical protein GBAR_LOCUS31400 [Geodia barretti]
MYLRKLASFPGECIVYTPLFSLCRAPVRVLLSVLNHVTLLATSVILAENHLKAVCFLSSATLPSFFNS